nr:hypothetical protein [Tanacetum cinerariifolium]
MRQKFIGFSLTPENPLGPPLEVVYLLGLVQDSNFGPGPTAIHIHLFNSLPILYEQVGAIRGTPNTITFSKILAISTNEQTQPSQPTSAVRNTLGKEQAPQKLVRPISDEALRVYCDKNCHQILPIIAEKLHQKKAQQEKLKAVKACLNFEETSQYSESEMPGRRRNLKERLGPRYARTWSGIPKPRHDHSKSPREKDPERRTVFKRLEKGVFHRLGGKEKNASAHSRGSERKSYYTSRRDTESCYQSSHSKETEIASEKRRYKREYSQRTEAVSEKSFPRKLPSTEKCIKDPIEIHNIKQRDEESTKDFVRRYKLEYRDVKGALKCMKISGFMHGVTNPELIKRLHDKIPKSMDEMMNVTIVFLRGEVAASNRERKKSFPSWKQQQIEEMLKTRKLSHLIKELKQNHRKDQAKTAKKGETSGNKPLAILMIQPWQRIARQRITQTFSLESVISFSNLGEEDGTKGPMIIEAEIGGHCVHRMYVDEGSSAKNLYEHYFSKFRPKIKNQLLPVNTPLVGFSREIIWPLGQISLLVKIGRPGVKKIRAIPSTAPGMLKFSVAGGIVTLRSNKIIPLECSMVSEPGAPRPIINQVTEEKIQVAIHVEYPKQSIAIGSTLTEEGRKELCELLRRHLDVFAWKPADMTGLKNVRGFQGLKQSMPQRWLSATENRLEEVTTRGGKMTTQYIQRNETNMNGEEPSDETHDKLVESNEVLMENQPEKTNEPIVQRSTKEQTPSIPFPRRLRKENKEARQRKFLEILKPFLATEEAMIDVFNKKITPRVRDDEVIFDVNQSIKIQSDDDDECYRINDLDNIIDTKTHEILTDDMSDSFLLKGVEKSDLESRGSLESETNDDSDLGKPIRCIDYVNTPYSVAQETVKSDEGESEHVYSASANEIDEKRPELKSLPNHLE